MPRTDDPTPYEWLVTLGRPGYEPTGKDDDTTQERVPVSLGGVDVGMMSADRHHYVVISDADNHAVWMRDAREVRGVKRCTAQ